MPMTDDSAGRHGLYRLFVRDLVVLCRIGVEEEERRTPQRVRIGLDLLKELRRTRPITDEEREVMFGAKQYTRR